MTHRQGSGLSGLPSGGSAGIFEGDAADVVAGLDAVLDGGGCDICEFVSGQADGDDFGARVGAGRSSGAGHGHSLESTVSGTYSSTGSLASSHLPVYDKSMTTTKRTAYKLGRDIQPGDTIDSSPDGLTIASFGPYDSPLTSITGTGRIGYTASGTAIALYDNYRIRVRLAVTR